MLTLFDNDGTLCDSQAAEEDCYTEANFRVTGRRPSPPRAPEARWRERSTSATPRGM
jgi:FMN phosphatase YigB (HAD superfamily)